MHSPAAPHSLLMLINIHRMMLSVCFSVCVCVFLDGNGTVGPPKCSYTCSCVCVFAFNNEEK